MLPKALPRGVMVPRSWLAPSWASLGTPGLATSSSAPLFWGCLAKPAPGKHHLAITPTGWSGLRDDARPAGGSQLHTFSQPRGFSGTGQAVSVAPSFGNNPETIGLVPALCLLGKLEGPVSPPGCDSSPLPFLALGSPGSQRAAVGQARLMQPPCDPTAPQPSASHCPDTAKAFGLPRGDLSPAGPPPAPGHTTHPHQPMWVPPGISASCNS